MLHAAAGKLVDEGGEEDVLIVRLLLLHGFTSTGRSWDAVRRRIDAATYTDVRAPDLRGHGDASDIRPATMVACVKDLAQDEPYALAGYSMGGRLALHLALAQPERVSRLVLVSTTAGIDGAPDRAGRRHADDEIADGIEAAGLETFARWWGAQTLFADQPPEVAAAAHRDRMRNTAAGLAASLRGMGTGTMAPLWDRLRELRMPAVVIAGERDAKFRALGERLADNLPSADLVIAKGAGHAVHLEAPDVIAKALQPRKGGRGH